MFGADPLSIETEHDRLVALLAEMEDDLEFEWSRRIRELLRL